jgi:hypothetical protein
MYSIIKGLGFPAISAFNDVASYISLIKLPFPGTLNPEIIVYLSGFVPINLAPV